MKQYNVLFTSAGRRVELIALFKKEGFRTIAADCDPTAPTLREADKKYTVPRIKDDETAYVDAVLDIVKKEKIDVIVPLLDPELPVFARKREAFTKAGAMLMVSGEESVEIASDKYKTYLFFKKIGLSVPETFLVEEVLGKGEKGDRDVLEPLFPVILKPRFGSAGVGIFSCEDMDYISFHHSHGHLKDYIIQRKVSGEEITSDIFGDGNGGLMMMAQRKRLKIRAGEVERGITVKYDLISKDAFRFTDHFRPFGTVNLQCFFDKEAGIANYIEINPRFGGGYPLAYRAGANFPGIIKGMLAGEKFQADYMGYEEGLIMTRYDSAFYYVP